MGNMLIGVFSSDKLCGLCSERNNVCIDPCKANAKIWGCDSRNQLVVVNRVDIENESCLGIVVNKSPCLAGLLAFLLHETVPDACAFARIAVMLDIHSTVNFLGYIA